MVWQSVRLVWAAVGVILMVTAGCQNRALVATPNLLYKEQPERYFAARGQAPDIEVLYATDRDVVQKSQKAAYGYGRAKRLAVGTALIKLDPNPTWKELIEESTRPDRRRQYTLKAEACREIATFQPDWNGLAQTENGVRRVACEMSGGQQALHDLLRQRLAESPQKDVYVFIHGFNNSFEDAVFRTAQVWHFMGRVGVPITYTWPAGRGGALGYLYDRESGEYTVFHLKQFLESVAACPAVERLHLVAHSRGTDVAITALRELNIAYRAQGLSTQRELKFENLVLAAPDLDEDVFLQRFVAEDLLSAAKRTTVYISQHDQAIEVADYAFSSRKRVGQLGPRDFTPQVRQALAKLPNLQFVECNVTHFSTSHDYVFAHPAALSDLILVLRERRSPGAEFGRPLRQAVEGVWELGNDYLK